jgi:hypothetical protein
VYAKEFRVEFLEAVEPFITFNFEFKNEEACWLRI